MKFVGYGWLWTRRRVFFMFPYEKLSFVV